MDFLSLKPKDIINLFMMSVCSPKTGVSASIFGFFIAFSLGFVEVAFLLFEPVEPTAFDFVDDFSD